MVQIWKGIVYLKEPFWVNRRILEVVWPDYPIPYKHAHSLKVFQDENRHFTASTPQGPKQSTRYMSFFLTTCFKMKTQREHHDAVEQFFDSLAINKYQKKLCLQNRI